MAGIESERTSGWGKRNKLLHKAPVWYVHLMREFDTTIVDRLNSETRNEPVHFVALGTAHFELGFDKLQIKTMSGAAFFIASRHFVWELEPTDAPIGLRLAQIPTNFELHTPLVLRMLLSSSDYVDFYTDELSSEAAIINFGYFDGVHHLEIF